MARSSVVQVRVEGLSELRRDLAAASDRFPKDIRGANKKAAEVVVPEAKGNAPVRSGKLRASILARAEVRAAYVKAGTPTRVPYAGVIHFGWPAHNIEPQPFLTEAIETKEGDVVDTYAELLDEIIRKAGFR